MTRIVFLDQNAWVSLARGAWDKIEFPREHVALKKVIEQVKSEAIMVPLTFANIYETTKINDPVRRANMARTQAFIRAIGRASGGERVWSVSVDIGGRRNFKKNYSNIQ